MGTLKVQLSANAGVILSDGERCLWIDALHRVPVAGFSCVSRLQWERMLDPALVSPPDLMLFSHYHPDHYSSSYLRGAHERYPAAAVASPRAELPDQILLAEEACKLEIKDVRILCRRTPHEGRGYETVAHYSFLILWGEAVLFIPGDAALGSQALAELIGSRKISLALLNFPWVTRPSGIRFLAAHGDPKEEIIYHLPFAPDDTCRYRDLTARALARYEDQAIHRQVLAEPFAALYFDLP